MNEYGEHMLKKISQAQKTDIVCSMLYMDSKEAELLEEK